MSWAELMSARRCYGLVRTGVPDFVARMVPTLAWPVLSTLARRGFSSAVPTLSRDIGRNAESEPHLTSRYAGGKGRIGSPIAELSEDEIACDHPTVAFAEFF